MNLFSDFVKRYKCGGEVQKMPQYDDSFILEDNANQRRNKRSYRVSKKGLPVNGTPPTVAGHGTYILKNNLAKSRKDFGSSHTILRENGLYSNTNGLYSKSANKSFPSLLDDPYKNVNGRYLLSRSNNDYPTKNADYFSGKSLENLSTHGCYSPLKGSSFFGHSRGKSLQNLHDGSKMSLLSKFHIRNSSECLPRSKDPSNGGQNVVPENVGEKRNKRLYETNNKQKEKAALRLATKILESGVYRQLGKARNDENDSGIVEDFDGFDGGDGVIIGTITPANTSSGHKASFRSANKLARRARSFKEDFLERISAMRSPGAPSGNSALSSLRSQSPLSPKTRNQQKNDESDLNPAKYLGMLVRQVQFDLKHFSDVITKKKLEMLPGNGTIVLDTIANIITAIKPYVSTLLSDAAVGSLDSAQNRLCYAVADLIRLCDESMILGEDCSSLNQSNVTQITSEIQKAVEDLTVLALEKITGSKVAIQEKKKTAVNNESKNSHSKPVVDNIRNNNNEGQRNSLPDIPLTPRERQILEGSGNNLTVRTSHSTESILDSVASTPHQEPPPKPPIPIRTIFLNIAPPLPPKKKHTDNNAFISTTDRASLQSHNSGSSDSMLNNSNDEEIRSIMDRNSSNLDDMFQHNISDSVSNCLSNVNNRSSQSTISSTCTENDRLSLEIASLQPHSMLSGDIENQFTNHKRFSSESGFASMGTTRSYDVSNSNFNNSNIQSQRLNLSFIDSTPTPIDMPSTLISDFIDKNNKASSPTNMNFSHFTNVIQKSMVQTSATNNFFEQNSKTFSSSFSHTSLSNSFNQTKGLDTHSSNCIKSESSIQNITKMESNISKVVDSNTTSICTNDTNNGVSIQDVTDCALPPALPIKTKKQVKSALPLEKFTDQRFNLSLDDQTVQLRDHSSSCALHGQTDGVIQRPHTLMNQSPPPLPIKKKHMFQSVAYSVMAYMEMFGNCSHSSQTSSEFLRHSLHEQNQYTDSHYVFPLQSNSSLSTTARNHFNHSSQTIQSLTQNSGSLISSSSECNQQLTQSHTLHHFSITGSENIGNQSSSEFSSPSRSPRLSHEESSKLQTSVNVSTNSLASTLGSNNTLTSIPPALPPKKTKIKQTPNHSPAKPPPSPKSSYMNSEISSPSNNTPLLCVTPPGSQTSVSPLSHFQFDQPLSVDANVSQNSESESWHHSTVTKPGKFPIEDIELEQNPPDLPNNDIESKGEAEIQSEVDIVLELDVSSHLIWKQPSTGNEEPELRGGHPDALIVHAIKCNKGFSYQEAFLATYRTFISPIDLVKKLNKRHTFFVKHGKYTKAREVQALLTRVVGDLTVADLDSDLLTILLNFVYDLLCSGDLAMAKVLRVVILERYKNKQLQQQSLAGACLWATAIPIRRDSLLDHKPEAIAEQMTLLDAELFTRIPVPEVLLWAQNQCEERSPNLTRFTEHFNKMSYWARSRILELEDAREREKYVSKFMKVMKHLRKINNFNSYLALLSALVSAPISRLDWPKYISDGLRDYGTLIDNTSSFQAYRQALEAVQPPCIPYLGMVLQDLTFVHVGNNELSDGNINFAKRWQQYNILEGMRRFSKGQYPFKKNEKILAIFNGFDEILNEETMWQISETIKPRGGKKTVS